MKKLPYILLKTALVVCFILGSNIKSFCADETFIYTIDFFTDNQQARVHIKAADGFINSNNYSTAFALPHFFENRLWVAPIYDIQLFGIHKLTNFSAFNSPLTFQEPLDSLVYFVDLRKVDYSEFIINRSFFTGNAEIFVNFSNFLGFFDENKENSIQLNIFINRTLTHTKNTNFSTLEEQPMLLNANTFSVKRSAMAADVMFNTNQHLFQNDIKTYIDEAFYAVQELTYNYPIKPKTFIFLVDTSLETVAAITHADAIVVQLNQTDKFTIQKTIIHELMHCILPNSNNWLNESAAEYLALKYMLKSALINESEFFLAISDKMKSADLVKSYSLLSLYNQSTPLQTKQNYLALYHKGAIWAFMLDLILNENANYRFGLEQFLIAEKSAENKIPAHLTPIYADFENKYIENNQGFSFNLFLNPVGILYEENKIQEIKAVQNINFLLKNGKMIILDNGGLNLLAENDIIISVDGMTRYEEIKKWLDNPTKKTAIFAIERDGEKKKINIDCQETLMVRLRFKLSFLEEKTAEQQTNWLEYLN